MSPPLTRWSSDSYADRIAADFLTAGIQGGQLCHRHIPLTRCPSDS
jgi:hypothetical protein